MNNSLLAPNGKILLDTNILLYASDVKSRFHTSALEIIKKAKTKDFLAFIAEKSLYEMFAVLTRGYKFSPEKAREIFEYYLFDEDFEILFTSPQTPLLISELIQEKKISGKYIFDIVLIALMRENGISSIYTKNKKDFQGFSKIRAVDPL